MDTSPTERTFPVEFSPPGAWRPSPVKHWGLIGAGDVLVGPDTIVLRGLEGRLPGSPASHSIPRPDIVNVVQEDRLVQCHVQTASGLEPLLMWAADPAAAAELVALLPTQRTPEFAERLALQEALRKINARVVVSPVLVGLNCLVFVSMALAGGGLFQHNGNVMTAWGSSLGPLTLGGQWWRLFTAMFLHWDMRHLAFNMWALWSVGYEAELLFGSLNFLAIYLFAGLFGGLVELWWHPLANAAGASGAIFGVLGGLTAFVLKPATRLPPSYAKPAALSAFFFIGFNLLYGVGNAGIAYGAHLGGVLSGAALGWLLARPLEARV
jgi:rhomboid protease GluP